MSQIYKFTQSTDEVFELMTDPDFLVERCIALGEASADCEVEEDGSKTLVTMKRVVSRDLPAALAKIFDPQQTLAVEEEWQAIGANRVGKSVFRVEGHPVVINAKFKLAPEGNGCVYSVEYTPKVSIPLLGGIVEKFILSQTREGVDREIDFLKQRLTEKQHKTKKK